MPSSARPASPGATSKATKVQSSPAAANAALWIAGEQRVRDRATR